jgi:hypothetical protein
VDSILPVLLLGLAGLLVGGVVQLRRNGAGTPTLVVMGVLATLAAAGGVLWLIPS